MTTMPERFVIDTNVFDFIIDNPQVEALVHQLIDAEKVQLLSTHIQRDEIDKVPDPGRRQRLRSLVVNEVPTFGFVIGVSRLDEARFGVDEPFENLRAGADRMTRTHDALITMTAQFEQATLVTNDRGLTARAPLAQVTVIGLEEFRARLEDLA